MRSINEIRVLPNSKSFFPTESEFRFFVEKTMIDRGGKYYFPGRFMHCGEGTLVLFQYDGKIRAFGYLIKTVHETAFDEKNNCYAGYYLFETDTLRYLSYPIDKESFRKVNPLFKRFSQAIQSVPMEYYDKLIQQLR